MNSFSRRDFVGTALFALAGQALPRCSVDRIATPFKLGKYVLNASGQEGAFDRVSMDCPFVFRREGQLYMAFVAYDGVGYQTGLATSPDLVHWQNQDCILKRDPSSEIRKYNIAMNWILRDNGLYSQGESRKVHGYYLGAYHAYPNRGLEQGAAVIGLCRSIDLRNWAVEPPCLKPQEGADWERGGLYKPHVC